VQAFVDTQVNEQKDIEDAEAAGAFPSRLKTKDHLSRKKILHFHLQNAN